MNCEQFTGWLEKKSQPFSISRALEKPLIMAVLNVTADSFSDGGEFLSTEKAFAHACALIDQGADIIDIGGESSRPGATPIPLQIELDRVLPVIERIREEFDVCISIDTYKPEVMSAAVHAGANIINDIYALRQEGALAMASKLAVPVCLMHMQGRPQDMQNKPQYPNGVVYDIMSFFLERIEVCVAAGIDRQHLILDPGFGFGKLVKDNLEFTYHLELFKEFNLPMLLGVSRKSTIGAVLGKEANNRLIGSIALTVYAALKGVDIIRTHDVAETKDALEMINALCIAGIADEQQR